MVDRATNQNHPFTLWPAINVNGVAVVAPTEQPLQSPLQPQLNRIPGFELACYFPGWSCALRNASVSCCQTCAPSAPKTRCPGAIPSGFLDGVNAGYIFTCCATPFF